MKPHLTSSTTDFQLPVRVRTFSSRSEVTSFDDCTLRVSLAAKPKDNEANEELIRILSEEFEVPKSRISIKLGHHSRDKVVVFSQVDSGIIFEKLIGVTDAGKRKNEEGQAEDKETKAQGSLPQR